MKFVISGIGVVTGSAWGRDKAEALFMASAPNPVEVDRGAGYHREGGARTALLVDTAPLGEWINPMAARRMSPGSRFAVCAALMACRDAGYDPQPTDGRTAVVLATTFGAATVTEKILRQIFLESPESVSPALFTESVANAPAAQVALRLGARGPNITVTQRQVGVVAALNQAAALMLSGQADRVLVGTVDEMSPLLHAALDRFGALARPDENGNEVARPFDARASGWVAGEGSCVVMLEREEDLVRRGRCAMVRLLGAGSAFDPKAPRSGWGRVPGPRADGLKNFLGCHGLSPQNIDVIASSAGGLPEADRLEAKLLREVWDSRTLPPVLAPSSIAGSQGCSLLAGAVVAAAGGAFGPTPGFAVPDPVSGVVPHDGCPFPPPEHVLLTTCAPGGAAGWAILGRGDISSAAKMSHDEN